MINFLQNEFVIVALTLLIYRFFQLIQQKTGIVLLNPILMSIVLIIALLSLFKIDYETFYRGGRYIDFFLKPAIVALGVPLYLQLNKIRRQAAIIVISQLIGCIFGVVSVALIAHTLGAPHEIIYSLAPKSATTPIAIEVSKSVGAIPALTTAVVVTVGMFGAIFGYQIMRLGGVKNPIAQSLSIGHNAHAIGTAVSMEISPNYGAMASIGLIVNGIFTALLTPYILKLMAVWIQF